MKIQAAFGSDFLGRKMVPKRVLGDPQRATKKEVKRGMEKRRKKGSCGGMRGSAGFCGKSGPGVVVALNPAELIPAGTQLNLMNTRL